MSWSVTIGNKTFTNESVEGKAYADEENGLPAILAAIVREADFLKGKAMYSKTPMIPQTGLVTFLVEGQVYGNHGDLVRIQSIHLPDHYMIGSLYGGDNTGVIINIHTAFGSGYATEWAISAPITMYGGDIQGHMKVPTGEVAAGGPKRYGFLGETRAVISVDDGIATFSALAGTNRLLVEMALMVNNYKIMDTEHRGSVKTFYGGNRLAGGLSYKFRELDYDSSNLRHVLHWYQACYNKVHLGAGTIVDFRPDSGTQPTHWVTELVQPATSPGIEPDLVSGTVLHDSMWAHPAGGVDWASQPASSSVIVKTEFYSGTFYHSAFGKHVDQSWTSSSSSS